MPEKTKKEFFLALDFKSPEEAHATATNALDFLAKEFPDDLGIFDTPLDGPHYPDPKIVGVKVNIDQVTGPVNRKLNDFKNIFADLKIVHGPDTGERILTALSANLPNVRYVTVGAVLGPTILRQYVEMAKKHSMEVVAFTAHTKIPEQEVQSMFGGQSLDDVIYTLGKCAADAGCHAMVLEAERLKDPRIRSLPIKKLVTGIRIDAEDKGTQSRVTTLETLREQIDAVDMIVVSSRYLQNEYALKHYFSTLLNVRRGEVPQS